MKIKMVEEYDYKLKITIQKKWYQSQYCIYKKVKNIMENFPNWNIYWENNFLIINLFFDSTGWDKDRENTQIKIEIVNLNEVR